MQLEIGQEWRFAARPTDPDPRLTIVRFESSASGEVVHISVRGVRILNPRVPAGAVSEVPHLPMSRAAVEQRVTELVGRAEPSALFSEGYTEWQRADGGFFTVPVADCLTLAERALR